MSSGVHTYHGRHRTRRRGPAVAIAGGSALALAAMAVLAISAEHASAAPNGKVTLCHATPPASAKNGWVQITVSTNAVTHAGHGRHADDIIPAFTYSVKGTQHSYPGMNLDTDFGGMTGRQLLDNGCAPSAPESTTATSSTAASGGASTEAAPGNGATGSDSAGSGTSSSSAAGGVEGVAVTRSGEASSANGAGANGAGVNGAGVNGGGAGIDAAHATAAANGNAVAPAAAGASGLAVGDTGDHGTVGGAATAAAVVGGSLAVLIGMGVLAMRRRRPDAGA